MLDLNEFKKFYLKSVLPNLKGYKAYFNERNFDSAINDLIDQFCLKRKNLSRFLRLRHY